MTRRTRRKLESAVEDLAANEDQGQKADQGGATAVYEDPVTGKLYDGYGEDAAPIEEVPDGRLVIQTRTLSMQREEAVADGYHILEELYEDDPRLDVVSVRVPHADHVDTEAAAVLPSDHHDRTLVVDFTQ